MITIVAAPKMLGNSLQLINVAFLVVKDNSFDCVKKKDCLVQKHNCIIINDVDATNWSFNYIIIIVVRLHTRFLLENCSLHGCWVDLLQNEATRLETKLMLTNRS